MAACDTDNHVLLFKHSVVEVQSANAEEVYISNEVGVPELIARSWCEKWFIIKFWTASIVLLWQPRSAYSHYRRREQGTSSTRLQAKDARP